MNKNQRNFDTITLVVHIIFAAIATLNIIFYVARQTDDIVGTENDTAKFSVLIVVYWLSPAEFYFNRGTQRMFWKDLFRIDRNFCSHKQYQLAI